MRLILATLLCLPLAAQIAGTFTGVVLDPSGQPIPDANVLIRSLNTSAERRVVTNDEGRYLAPGLPPGGYVISVSRSGFRSGTLESIDLGSGRVQDVHFHLAVGDIMESVTITESPALVDTAASAWGGAMSRSQIQSLPSNGRDIFELAVQQPGASIPPNATRSMLYGQGTRVSVNGMRPNQNGFQIDGIRINEATGAAPASVAGVLLGQEGIAELRVVTNPFSAEYGRAAGGVFTTVTRSGSNAFHGSLYEYLRNSALDARNFFDAPDQPIPPFRRNQFGAMLTGPIRRNMLFFASNYEGFRDSLVQTQRSVTLTAAARQGLLPNRQVTVAAAVKPFLALYPLPNGREFGDGAAEYIATVPSHTTENYFSQKIDAYVSPHLRLFGRGTWDSGRRDTSDHFNIWNLASTSQYVFLHTGAQFVASPTTIHEFRAGFSRVSNYELASVTSPSAQQLSFIPGQPLGSIDVTGLSEIGGGAQRLQPRRYVINDYQFNYSLAHMTGRHHITTGAGFDRVQFNQIADNVRSGYYRITSIQNLLQAAPRLFDAMAPGSDSVRGWRQSMFYAFVQDEYRPASRLSISAGIRYETYSTPTEVNGKIAVLRDPVNDSKVTIGGPLFENPSRANFAPRVALAWNPRGDGRTVIRAGGGIFFDLLSTRELVVAGVRMPPFFRRMQITNPSFPDGLANVAGAAISESIDTFDPRPSQPYVGQYQLFVERQVRTSGALRIGYVGSRGIHLPGHMSNFNIAVPQILDDGRAYFAPNAPLRNPALGQVGIRLTNFDSSYHGLQAGFQSSWRTRYHGQIKYSFSKSIDTSSRTIFTDFAGSDRMPTPLNYRLNRGLSDFDLRHVFAANGSAFLPFGFELHGLIQLQSGPPFHPSVGFDRARLRAGTADLGQRPDYAATPGAAIIRGDPAQWFDPLAFALPEAGFYGNLGRNTLRGPDLSMASLAVHKVLWRREDIRLRLRAECFNVSNTPNFQVPSDLFLFDSTGRRVGSAGRISETATGSRQIQLALRLDF